jgi:hypothetical protein
MPRLKKPQNVQADKPMHEFFKTRFMRRELTDSTSLYVEGLTNDIHPLHDIPLRAAVPRLDVVEQSARLATQLIEGGPLDSVL